VRGQAQARYVGIIISGREILVSNWLKQNAILHLKTIFYYLTPLKLAFERLLFCSFSV
jgi:hypothetical protein